MFSLDGKRVWIAGHRGLVGSALVGRLRREACEMLTADSKELDLRNQSSVNDWMDEHKPQAIIVSGCQSWQGSWLTPPTPWTFCMTT